MGSAVRKQYLLLAGKPIFCRTLEAFGACSCIDDIHLVVPAEDVDVCFDKWVSTLALGKAVHVVAGGIERQDSVYRGILAASAGPCRHAVIHDAVRPFISSRLIEDCVAEARNSGACIVGMPLTETAKQVEVGGRIVRTLDRTPLWLAQTPQAFELQLIRTAHDRARRDHFTGTDDAMLVERLGHPVRIIQGSRLNFKITTPEDMTLAEGIIQQKNSVFV